VSENNCCKEETALRIRFGRVNERNGDLSSVVGSSNGLGLHFKS
jgi:hypothetical protein